MAREVFVLDSLARADGQTLTRAGAALLGKLDCVKFKGSSLTDLLAAAREAAKSPAADGPAPDGLHSHRPTPPDDQLDSAILTIFLERLRGDYANLGMVPIHEIRDQVAERFGPQAVPHAVFNERMLELRRRDRVNLVSIDDRSRATPEQLRDSVHAVGETFFYVEKHHGSE